MNEVTKIHLGREAYTISTEAYHALRTYLDAIAKTVSDQDVVNEIEVRMTELLSEHGLTADKVILPGDVDFLKQQLGDPKDFKEEGEEESKSRESSSNKRLFRDTDNAMIAGVAAGLAEYLGIDVLVIRLLFVVLTLATVGWAILLYILLWLLVPEAKSPSDRLQMAGKPITVSSLKEAVENADVKGAARRANRAVAEPINRFFDLCMKLIGIAFVVSGLSAIFGLIAWETYFITRSQSWAHYNIFPIGTTEHILYYIGLGMVTLASVFVVIFGIAIFRRKWPIHTWITGVLVGLMMLGLATGGALLADVYPTVRDAYNANVHTITRSLPSFSSLNSVNADANVNINFVTSDRSYVTIQFYDHPNVSLIKTTVTNGVLTIDSSAFNPERDCQTLCVPRSYEVTLTVYSPNALQLQNQFVNNLGDMPTPPNKPYWYMN